MNEIKILDVVSRATGASITNQDLELSLPAIDPLLSALWAKVLKDDSLGDVAFSYSTWDGKKRKDFIRTFCSSWPKKMTIRCTAGERVDIFLELSSLWHCESENVINVFNGSPKRVLSWDDAWIEGPNIDAVEIYSFEIVKEFGHEPALSIELRRVVPDPVDGEEPKPLPPLEPISGKDVVIRIGDVIFEKGTLNADVICTVCNT